MELWDLYNEHRELTGRDHIRGEEVPQGFYHLKAHDVAALIELPYGVWNQKCSAINKKAFQKCQIRQFSQTKTGGFGPSSATRTRGLMLPKHPPYQLGYTRI